MKISEPTKALKAKKKSRTRSVPICTKRPFVIGVLIIFYRSIIKENELRVRVTRLTITSIHLHRRSLIFQEGWKSGWTGPMSSHAIVRSPPGLIAASHVLQKRKIKHQLLSSFDVSVLRDRTPHLEQSEIIDDNRINLISDWYLDVS